MKAIAYDRYGPPHNSSGSTGDRAYPLNEVPEAMQYLQGGRARGKIIITIDHSRKGQSKLDYDV